VLRRHSHHRRHAGQDLRRTGQLDETGTHSPGGWWWRYDLVPTADGTDVTVTYDWSETSQYFRDVVGVPVFGSDFIEASLATLERTVTGR
jgi:hypothetical protein